MTAPSLDGGGANSQRSNSGAMNLAFTTDSANAIAVLFVYVEAGSTTTPNTMVASVATVTSPALTWTRRFRTPGTGKFGYIDVWWAVLPAAGSYGVQVTFNSNFDDAAASVLTFKDCNTSSPFDADASLPNAQSYTAITVPTVTGVHTSQAEAYLLWFVAINFNQIGDVPAGWTQIALVQNNGAQLYAWILGAGLQTATQVAASDTFTWGGTVGVFSAGYAANYSYFDALRPATGGGTGGGGTTPPVTTGTGQVQVIA